MDIFPAIDLLEGCAVRLHKGRREEKTIYSDNPVGLVQDFVQAGAKRIHIVDLEGAFEQRPVHTALIKKMAKECDVPIQVGGGVRSFEHIEEIIANGASFVVIGTSALRDPELVQRACTTYPGKIVIAVDAVNGIVSVAGWTQSSGVRAVDLGKQARSWGAAALLYTDVDRDGTEQGPATKATASLESEAGLPVIASGGVGHFDHLIDLQEAGIKMVIVGKAIYEKRFVLSEAISKLRKAAQPPQ